MYVNSSLTAQRIKFFTGLRFFWIEWHSPTLGCTERFRLERNQIFVELEVSIWIQVRSSIRVTAPSVVNFFHVEAETRRRWDIFQAEVTLYWELAVRRCSHPSLTIAQHSRVYTFQGGGIHRGGDNLNKACKCSTGISPLPEFPQPWPHQHNSVIQMHRC